MASSSGCGCSLLKARNTAYIKNALGSIFIRITHLFRFLIPITRLRSCERPVSTTSQAYDLMTSASSASRRVRNSLASRLCFCVGYTLAHHEATHGWWQTIVWGDCRWLWQELAMWLEDHRLARRAGGGTTRTRRDTWDDSMGRWP